MARIRVTHSIGNLADDCAAVARRVQPEMSRVVRKNAQRGNRIAKANARPTAGAHGKHYPDAFTAEMLTPLVAEYGPDAARPQGGMSFEFGSRNQPPHLDLNKSADVAGPLFARDVSKVAGRWFW